MGLKISSLLFLFVMSVYVKPGNAEVDCIICDWNIASSTASQNCYSYDPNSSDIDTPTQSCSAFIDPYCLTQFTFTDGILTSVSRSCASAIADHDASTDGMPQNDKCVSVFNVFTDNVDITTCYLHCNDSNACNDMNPSNLKVCPSLCGIFGTCNYITGTCDCEDGYTGETCSTAPLPPAQTFISCLQCDSETGEDGDACIMAATDSYRCPSSSHRYCSVTSVRTFDKNKDQVRRFISRSCTESYVAANECFVTDEDSNGLEYTCVSTCDTDGCNTETPDGLETNVRAVQPLQCVICDSENDGLLACSSKTISDACPSNSVYCTSVVSYYLSEKGDLPQYANPDYRLASVVRSCSSTRINTRCTEDPAFDGTSLKFVTCTESCSDDGCNYGWPARPKCSQCSCSSCSRSSGCIVSPSPPSPCSYPYQNYCLLEELNKDKNGKDFENGYWRQLVRNCSHFSAGNTCSSSQYSDSLENCYKTCTEDGCNLGFTSSIGTIASSSFSYIILQTIALLIVNVLY